GRRPRISTWAPLGTAASGEPGQISATDWIVGRGMVGGGGIEPPIPGFSGLTAPPRSRRHPSSSVAIWAFRSHPGSIAPARDGSVPKVRGEYGTSHGDARSSILWPCAEDLRANRG